MIDTVLLTGGYIAAIFLDAAGVMCTMLGRATKMGFAELLSGIFDFCGIVFFMVWTITRNKMHGLPRTKGLKGLLLVSAAEVTPILGAAPFWIGYVLKQSFIKKPRIRLRPKHA